MNDPQTPIPPATPFERFTEGIAERVVEDLAEVVAGRADPSAPDEFGVTPLYRAARIGDVDLAVRLLELGADPDSGAPGGRKALHVFCELGDLEGIRRLLEAGADPDVFDVNESSPATLSSANPEALALLASVGADLSRAGPLGFSPAHAAATAGAAESLRRLAGWKVPVGLPDAEGRTPLHYAALAGSESVEALLDAGADASAKDRLGRSPLFDARDPKSALALVAAGADPSALSAAGLLPEQEIRAAAAKTAGKGDSAVAAHVFEAAAAVRARREESELFESCARAHPRLQTASARRSL